ncbi:MAG TPA: dephospho-CoA kinase [Rubrivivax sp.]|nr:dephospho-CoA kinase [Rubrivivax sp.]
MSRLHIGLTGGIGSGKSTVAAMLVACGAVLVDTDAIAHALTAPGGAALPALAHEFGPDIIAADGSMDRAGMRALVFSDASAKSRLESILHPMIGTEGLRQAEAAETTPVVFDVPLLTDSSHWRGRVARVLVVDCLESTQVQRVMQRSGWSEAQVRRVIAQQSTRAARRTLADAVIFNDGLPQAALEIEVQVLWNRWNAMTRGGASGL